MNIKYLELTGKNYEVLTGEQQHERLEKFNSFIRNIDIKISMTKLLPKFIRKDELLIRSNKAVSEHHKEYLAYINEIMPESIEMPVSYVKIEDCNVEAFKAKFTEFFHIGEVSEKDKPYVASLFMVEGNAYWYTIRLLHPLQPLSLWDL